MYRLYGNRGGLMKLFKLIALLMYTTIVIAVGMYFGMDKAENGADERAEIRIQKKVHIAGMVNRPVMIGTGKYTVQIFHEQIAGAEDFHAMRSGK
jgi:hypothetical protein